MTTAIDSGQPAPVAEPAPESIPQPATATTEPSRGANGKDPAPKKARTPVAAPKKNHQPSEQTVLSRARRLTRKNLKPVAVALGLEDFSEDAVLKKLQAVLAGQQQQPGQGQPGQPGAPAPNTDEIVELKGQLKDLQKQVQTMEVEKLKAERRAISAERSMENLKIEQELRGEAQAAGIVDLDYAIDLMKRHASKLSEDQELDPKAFFEGLKSDPTKRALFERTDVPAGPPSIANDPKTQQQPAVQTSAPAVKPGDQPAPKPTTAPPEAPVNADEMSPRDFKAHTQKYGYRHQAIG